jgi:peptidoglycan/LPS O-acetylase OafA/YrhL
MMHRHMPALDGLRGLAVLAVLAFHADLAQGGFLGVTVFFVLSGFLIGSLLLTEHEGAGRIDLARFWQRRARRLVPAALVLIAVVIAYVALTHEQVATGVVGDGFASAAWVANWRFVFSHQAYADLFSQPSPFQHMWSLAVEEQFYLVLPLLAVVLAGRRRRFALVVAGLIAASVVVGWTAGGRAYFSTDTRAAEPLIGVLLALALTRSRPWGRRGRAALHVLGVVGLGGLVAMVILVNEHSPRLHRGGLLAAALLSAAVVASATDERTAAGRVLALKPLRGVGLISYGIYLYHWPVFLLFDAHRTGLSTVPLLALRTAVTMALALLSYRLVERPIRWGRLRPRVGLVGWANATVGLLAGLVAVAAVAPAPANSLFASEPTEEAPPLPPGLADTTRSTVPSQPGAPVAASGPSPRPIAKGTASASAVDAWAAGGDPLADAPSAHAPAPPATTGAPRLRIAVVGDSMALGLAAGLTAWAQQRQDVVVYDLSTSGCPLSVGGDRRLADGQVRAWTPVCGWWDDPQSDRAQKFAQFDPDIVVWQDSMNEVPDRDIEGAWRTPGDPVFNEWLDKQYVHAAETFTRAGARLAVLNPVCADWSRMSKSWRDYGGLTGSGRARLASLDRVTRQAVAGHHYGDLNAELCPDGQFSDTVAGVDDARPDGYHLTKEAATAVATKWLGPLVLSVAKEPPSPPSDASTAGGTGPPSS